MSYIAINAPVTPGRAMPPADKSSAPTAGATDSVDSAAKDVPAKGPGREFWRVLQ